jgi:hypothetical protein
LLEGEKKRRGFVFWWYGGAAVALLLAVALWKFNSPGAVDTPRTENTGTTEKANEAKAKAEEEYVSSGINEPVSAEAEAKAEAKAENVELKADPSNTNQNLKTKSSQSSNKTKPVKAGISNTQNSQTDSNLKPHTKAKQTTANEITKNQTQMTPFRGQEAKQERANWQETKYPKADLKLN